jgi:hypothetical protein
MITIKIDVTKISKSRLYKGGKGTYLNCTLIDTPNSEYGDYMIVEETTKAEREAGTKGTILGNGKIVRPKGEQVQVVQTTTQTAQDIDDVLPF